MRVLLVIALCFLVSPVIYAQMLKPETYMDRWPNGQTKTLLTTKRTLDGAVINHGSFASFYENSQIEIRGEYVEDVRQGEWEWYYPTGEVMARCEYQDGVGTFTGFFKGPNKGTPGAVSRRGEFHDDKRVGVWTEWFESGGKKMEGPFVDDQQHGVWRYWAEEDQSQSVTAEWKHGKRVQ